MDKELKEKVFKALKENKFGFINKCGFCGYECCYHYKNNILYYDNGCYCTGRGGGNLRPVNNSEIENLIQINKPEIIESLLPK